MQQADPWLEEHWYSCCPWTGTLSSQSCAYSVLSKIEVHKLAVGVQSLFPPSENQSFHFPEFVPLCLLILFYCSESHYLYFLLFLWNTSVFFMDLNLQNLLLPWGCGVDVGRDRERSKSCTKLEVSPVKIKRGEKSFFNEIFCCLDHIIENWFKRWILKKNCSRYRCITVKPIICLTI